MIFLYLWIVNTNALYVILYFKQMKKTNTHMSFELNQIKFSCQNRQTGWYQEAIKFCDKLISRIMLPYQYLTSTKDVAIHGILYASYHIFAPTLNDIS